MGIKDLTGKDILNVHVDSLNKVDRRSYWNVTCVCGKQFVVDANRLKQNKVFINCGNNEFHNIITEEEKKLRPHIFNTYRGFMSRVFDKNNSDYKDYGNRGITVSDEFQNYYKFRDWAIKNNYKEGLTLDRIDVNGNYSRDNVRWATSQEQALNKRNSSDKSIGIYRSESGRYRATVKRNQITKHLGTFDTFEEAFNARKAYLDNTHDDEDK